MKPLQVPSTEKGARLDAYLARVLPDQSRSRIARLIDGGHVTVDGGVSKPSHRLKGGEAVQVVVPPPAPADIPAEAIPLDVLYEDADIIVVNKPAGLVVHPGAGRRTGTLVNALLHRCPDLAGIGDKIRPGIVHRLDRDTSGVMAAAKTERAHRSLAAQFKNRTVEKEYLAVVAGRMPKKRGRIEAAIGRHATQRKKMTTRTRRGREAVTEYRVVAESERASLLSVRILTGRTHQIRVHMAASGHPVLGDGVYGGKSARPADVPLPRQMLHARRLAFTHPVTGERLSFAAPIPEDMRNLLERLRLGISP
ncbi:MAG: RluA family pseudouridine synthase [Nitrospirota bacterium]